MRAKETETPFNNKNWLYEIKWDGYRAIANIENNKVKLYSRNGNSFNKSYPQIIEALAKMNINAVLDGEIVALDKKGIPSFQLLQHYNNNSPLIYYVFDLLYVNKKNICSQTLIQRKKQLKKLIKKSDVIKYSDHVKEKGKEFYALAGKQNLEGIMAKQINSNYLPGTRTSCWLKIKHHKTMDAIIAGYTKPQGSRSHFGSLVLAIKKGNKLNYIGQTGTGFNSKKLKEINELIKPLIIKESPIKEIEKINISFTPVKPKIVCEVKYTEITNDGKLRHPVFLRLRDDKKATEVNGLELAIKKTTVQEKQKINVTNSLYEKVNVKKENNSDEITFGKIKVKVTNKKKVFWPNEGLTKGDVIDYYESIADYILPYLKERPESLKRNPNGILEKSFFHKDAAGKAPEWVNRFKIYSESANKDVDYIVCNNKPSLIYLANLGCIELNPWHSTINELDKPDYMVIDIDPSEKNTFEEVIETALVFKQLLDKAGAQSYCKTSGATGMHIYVPMGKKYYYDQVKDFAHIICMLVQTQLPTLTTLERNLAKRNKKHIYLDYLQNRRGQTIAAAYCLRPKKGAPVSMPIKWREVKNGLSPIDFNIHNALNYLQKTGDDFSGIFGNGVFIEKCIENLNN